VELVIFVDVDGVLNIGAADNRKTPVLFNDANLRFAQCLWAKRESHPERQTVESLMAISQKRLDGETETLVKLAAKTPSHLSDVLVGRLAEILEVTGPRAIIVLSSTWQAARHKARLQDLEKSLSRCLGREFSFDANTGSSEEKTADGRLRAIGNYVAQLTSRGGAAAAAAEAGRLRMLVLEDFFISPLGSWSLDGRLMDSSEAVEEYIRSRVPSASAARVSVRLIHTYTEWSTDDGMLLRCGVGISLADLQRSKEFLVSDAAESSEHEGLEAANSPKPKLEAARGFRFHRAPRLQGLLKHWFRRVEQPNAVAPSGNDRVPAVSR